MALVIRHPSALQSHGAFKCSCTFTCLFWRQLTALVTSCQVPSTAACSGFKLARVALAPSLQMLHPCGLLTVSYGLVGGTRADLTTNITAGTLHSKQPSAIYHIMHANVNLSHNCRHWTDGHQLSHATAQQHLIKHLPEAQAPTRS